MYAPQHIMTNDELAQKVATSNEWIVSHTGIERRHVAGEHESSAQMAIAAARAALRAADANPRDIDLVIVGTATPDHPLPSTACQVQDALGAIRAGAFDLNAGCSGFVYALVMGHQAIASGEHKLVLVVGVDTLTRTVNWQDRNTCVLFGDGAGAVLLRATEGPAGVLATLLGSDGSGKDLLIIPAGGSLYPASRETLEQGKHYLQMNGREVYRFATRILPDTVGAVVKKAGLTMDDVALIIPHQANMRILESAANRLNVPLAKFVTNLQRYGNTSAASIPIALCEAIESGRVQPGQCLVMVGFGAGLTWAAVVLRWSVPPQEVAAPFYRSWWRWVLYRGAGGRSRTRQWLRHFLVELIRLAEKRGK